MPVTSLPIYGLRKRAGPGGFWRHMANLHTGSAARAPPGSRLPTPSPRVSEGVGGARPEPQLGCEAEGLAGRGRAVGPTQATRGERAGAGSGAASRGGEEFRFAGTFQKRRRSGAGGSASPALVWEPFRKIKLRKETERSRDTTVKPLLTFLAAQNRKHKEAAKKKKK